MNFPDPQHYRKIGTELGISEQSLTNSTKAIQRLQANNPNIYPVLTLKHLSLLSGVSYGFLRLIVARKIHPYRTFTLAKKDSGRRGARMINAPKPDLYQVQKWITEYILRHVPSHIDSYAFHPRSNPIDAAKVHLTSRHLIKIDIRDFFHSVTERQIYQLFRDLGYQKLISFEMARICTIGCQQPNSSRKFSKEESAIPYYEVSNGLGILPQGAPTSPMLSNLVFKSLDQTLSTMSDECGLRYSRYADDLAFSSLSNLKKGHLIKFKNDVLVVLNQNGFRPNLRKTKIIGSGARKIVLGVIVNDTQLRLPREYKDNIRLHLYYLSNANIGPSGHAKHRKTSVSKVYNHVLGKIFWAKQVEPQFGERMLEQFNLIDWPPVTRWSYGARL